MKIFSLFLIVAISIFSWCQMGSADRLHHWVDSKGVTHLSKDPPPDDGKLIEIMEYSIRTDKPAKFDQVETGSKLEEKNANANVEKIQKKKELPVQNVDLSTACYIHPRMQDAYVYVTEDNRPDGPQVKILWKGNIIKGQKKLVRSSRGKIKFTYKRSTDNRTYGGTQTDCVNGNMIQIK